MGVGWLKPSKIGKVLFKVLRPLQSSAGMAHVDEKFKRWEDQAKMLYTINGTSMKKGMFEILKRQANVGINAYIDPDGRVRPDDSHHKLLAILKATQIYGLDLEKLEIKVNIAKESDYRKKTWELFGIELERKGLGLLSVEQRAESDRIGEGPGERIQRLPENFLLMIDSPMRSATGRLFEILGLSGTQFLPMIQFELAERLKNAGMAVEAGDEFSHRLQGSFLSFIFGNEHNAEVTKLLVESALPQQRRAVQESIAKAQRRYLLVREALERGYEFDDEDFEEMSASGHALKEDPEDDSLKAKAAFVMARFVYDSSNLLPKSVSISNQESFYRELFESAHFDLIKLNPNETQRVLSAIKDHKLAKVSRGDFRFLKEMRRGLIRLRSAYRLFSSEGAAPEEFDQLTTSLGVLNDQIWAWSVGRESTRTVEKTAKSVLNMIKRAAKLYDQEIKSISMSEFIRSNRSKLGRIESAITGKELSVDEYHWLRRRIREYAILFQLQSAKTSDPADDLMANMLSNLSLRMGKFKDGLMRSKIASQFKNPGDQPTRIDPESRKLIEKFIVIMRNSFENIHE